MTNSYPKLYWIALCKLPMKIPNDPCFRIIASHGVWLLLTSTYGKHDGISQAITWQKQWEITLTMTLYKTSKRERVVFLGSEEGSCHAVRASMKRATWKLTVVLANNWTLVKQPQKINYAYNLDMHGNGFFPSGLQMRKHSGCLDDSLVISWAKNPATPCSESWLTKTMRLKKKKWYFKLLNLW